MITYLVQNILDYTVLGIPYGLQVLYSQYIFGNQLLIKPNPSPQLSHPIPLNIVKKWRNEIFSFYKKLITYIAQKIINAGLAHCCVRALPNGNCQISLLGNCSCTDGFKKKSILVSLKFLESLTLLINCSNKVGPASSV